MIKVVQSVSQMSDETILNAGFEYKEIRYEDIAKFSDKKVESVEARCGGMIVSMADVTYKDCGEWLGYAKSNGIEYVVIETIGCQNKKELYDFIYENAAQIIDSGLDIYIENGMVGNDTVGYKYGVFSEASDLLEITSYANQVTNSNLFGVAINIGYANLLEKNVPAMIIELGSWLKLLHINDNDGRRNLKQMPYTFTAGRGDRITDWNKILGALIHVDFQGYAVFDTSGLYNNVSANLYEPMLKLQSAIVDRWEKQFNFEDVLKGDKQIILFGAGAMARNYIVRWGGKYPPVFLVDNNKDIWGKLSQGIEIRPPESILEIPEDERVVIICNKYFNEISAQLSHMGVKHEYYNDEYYMIKVNQ